MTRASWQLVTRAPFHLEATVRVLQRRPTNLVERWEHDRYLRVIETRAGLALVEVENRGTIVRPDVRFSIHAGSAAQANRAVLARVLRAKLGLDIDPRALQARAEAEPRLRSIALALRGMRPPRFADLFEAFANVIPFQQVSLDAGIAIVGRLVARFGRQLDHGGVQHHAFPTAATIADARLDALRRCGLSRQKATSLQHCARLIASGELSEQMFATLTTPDAQARLTELPGIGRWSAAVVLLRGLGRLDVFPPGDVGALARLGEILRTTGEAQLQRLLDRFGDYRGYLYFCAIGSALLARGLIADASAPTAGRARRRAG